MFRLALHWQILLGMIAGSLIGIGFNLLASTRVTTVVEELPSSVVSATVSDSTRRTEIAYIEESGTEIRRVVDPLSPGNQAVRTLSELHAQDPIAEEIYLRHGQTAAKRWGGWFKRFGGLFLRMLQMVAVPLIVTSLLTGILGLGSGQGIGRLFRTAIAYYLVTSGLAILTGIFVVNLIRPGLNTSILSTANQDEIGSADSLGDLMFTQIETMIPANPMAALVAPNFLSVIAFTILFGIFALRVGGATLDRLKSLAGDGFEVMMAMTMAIIRLAPLGVFFLMAHVTATQGTDVFLALGWYVLSVALALAIHAGITLPLLLRIVAKRRPLAFAKAMSPALLTAFSSASSNGTLPLTLTSAERRAGISNRNASFVLPLGATVNMDGTALYEAVAVLFIAQIHYGQSLPLSQQMIVAVTALLASIGAAGIPHAGLIMMIVILQAVGLPIEMQGVILAVDRVLDMARTAVNVWSDSCGCAVVERFAPPTDFTPPPERAATTDASVR